MPRRTPRSLLSLVALCLLVASCGGGGGGPTPGPGPDPEPQPPAVTITEYETDANGDATILVGGSQLTLTFVDNLTDEPLEGLYVEVSENAVDSILSVTDPFGEYATYGSFVDPASFTKMGAGRTRGLTRALGGFWGVDFIDDIMGPVPGVLSYVSLECWEAWVEGYTDFDGDADVGGLGAWLTDLIDEQATADIVEVIAAKELDLGGGDPAYALLSGSATYDDTATTAWLATWADWYRQSCYGEDAPISVFFTLFEGLLTVVLLPPIDGLPPATVTYAAIAGRILDLDTRQPVEGAAVVPAHLWMESISDVNGDYSLLDVDVFCDRYDEVVFVVEAPGYYPYGFTGAEAGLNGLTQATYDITLEPAIPWTFYGPAEFSPTGGWSTSPDIAWQGSDLAWSTGATLTAAHDALDDPLEVVAGDRIEFEMRYFGHLDANARQQVNAGFTSDRDATGVTPAHFIGLNTRDDGGAARTSVILSKAGVSIVPFSVPHAQDVPTTFHVLLIVMSDSQYRLVVDQDGVEQYNAVLAGNLVGATVSQCAVWNAATGLDPFEGAYQGRLLGVRWRGLQN